MEELDIGVWCAASILDGQVMTSLEMNDHGVERDGAGGHDGHILSAVVALTPPSHTVHWCHDGLIHGVSLGPGQHRDKTGSGVNPGGNGRTRARVCLQVRGCLEQWIFAF